MKKHFLVTGGTGFIGSNLVHSLIKDGHRVRVLDNDSRGTINRLSQIKNEIDFVVGDVRDADLVKKACQNIDCIIHLAYINGTGFFYSKPELVLDVGVTGMFTIIKAGIKKNVPELFLASSSEVYATPAQIPTPESAPLIIPDITNPRFSYSGGKILSELLTIHFGKKYFKRAVIFRPHNIYGPDMGREHAMPQMVLRMVTLSKKTHGTLDFPIQGTGHESRAYMYIDDAISAIRLLLRNAKHEEIYNIGAQEETTTKQLAQEIAKILKLKIKIKSGKLQPGSPFRRVPNIYKIKSLGFIPKIKFNEGLPNVVKWYTSNYA